MLRQRRRVLCRGDIPIERVPAVAKQQQRQVRRPLADLERLEFEQRNHALALFLEPPSGVRDTMAREALQQQRRAHVAVGEQRAGVAAGRRRGKRRRVGDNAGRRERAAQPARQLLPVRRKRFELGRLQLELPERHRAARRVAVVPGVEAGIEGLHGIPTSLCVCRLSRHCGCCRQYSTARRCCARSPGRPSAAGRNGGSRARRSARAALRLRIDQLQLVAPSAARAARRPWADADPVDARGRGLRAVGLDRDLEAAGVQRVDQAVVELQQRLAAGAHHKRPRARHAPRAASARAMRVGQRRRRRRTARRRGRRCPRSRCRRSWQTACARSSSRPVHRLQPAKRQNTAGRPALRALALQRVEDLLDRVAHGASAPAAPAPLAPAQDRAAAGGLVEVDAVELRQRRRDCARASSARGSRGSPSVSPAARAARWWSSCAEDRREERLARRRSRRSSRAPRPAAR